MLWCICASVQLPEGLAGCVCLITGWLCLSHYWLAVLHMMHFGISIIGYGVKHETGLMASCHSDVMHLFSCLMIGLGAQTLMPWGIVC